MQGTKLSFWVADGLDTEREVSVPAIVEICPRCNGRGVTDPPAFNGLSGRDFEEDPEFSFDYFQGLYDVTCEVCNGSCAILQPDRNALTDEELDWVDRWDEQEYLVQELQTRDVPYLDLP